MANKKFSDLEVSQIDDLNAESTYMPVEEVDATTSTSETVSIKLSDLLDHGGGSGKEYIDKTNGIGYGELSIRQLQNDNLPNLSIQASTVGQTFKEKCNIALGSQNTAATQNIINGNTNNVSSNYNIAVGDGNITTVSSHNIIIGNGNITTVGSQNIIIGNISTVNGNANVNIGTVPHLITGDNNYVNMNVPAYIAGTNNIVYGSAPLGSASTVANIGSNNIINVSSGVNFGSFGTSNLIIASAALGGSPIINTKYSLIAGSNQSSMSGEGILAIGTQNYSNGSTGSIVFGNQSSVHNATKGAISGGYRAQAYGDFAISIGQDATAYSNGLAFGQNVVAAGASSPSTSDTNVYSTIGFGAYTSALGQGSLGGGSYTTVLGDYSVGIGNHLYINGSSNACFGSQNTVMVCGCTIVGGRTNNISGSSDITVFGAQNTVSDTDNSSIIGYRNQTIDNFGHNHIFGNDNYIGNASSVTALGNYNTVTKNGSIAMLSGNANTTNNAILAIGNGAAISSGAGNLIELTADGYMSLHGYTGDYVEPINDTHITTKKYVDDKVIYLYVLQNGADNYCSSTPDTLTTVTSSAIDNMVRDLNTHLPTGKQVYLVASSTLDYTDNTTPLEIASLVKTLDTNTGKVIFGIFNGVSKYWTVDAAGVVVGTTV